MFRETVIVCNGNNIRPVRLLHLTVDFGVETIAKLMTIFKQDSKMIQNRQKKDRKGTNERWGRKRIGNG